MRVSVESLKHETNKSVIVQRITGFIAIMLRCERKITVKKCEGCFI